jgi:hypothetical protein
LASTGEFTESIWVSTGTVQKALIHCTVIQLGEEFNPFIVESQCNIPLVFDNGDMMFWQGVETIYMYDEAIYIDEVSFSNMPFAIEGGRGEWVGATGQGYIDCEFYTPPQCTATGVVCKSELGPEIMKLMYSKASKESFN